MPDLAYVNGRVSALEDAVVSVNDRAFTFGDAIYDFLRTCNKKPFLLDLHLQRVKESCHALGIDADKEVEELPKILNSLIEQSAYDECAIYIQISRGEHPRDIIIDDKIKPSVVVTAREFNDNAAKYRATGAKTILHPDLRWERSGLKTTNLVGSVIAKNKAAAENAKEAILFRENSLITEACSSTVFMVKDGQVHTPPLNGRVVGGITREHILAKIAPECEIETIEDEFSSESLLSADEVFICATSLPILPIIEIGDRTIGNGKPGPVSEKLIKRFLSDMGNY